MESKEHESISQTRLNIYRITGEMIDKMGREELERLEAFLLGVKLSRFGVAEGMKLAGKTNEKRKSETPQAEEKPREERA